MEPGGIGNADRLPARALRASAARQGAAAQPAEAEQPNVDPVDSADISPEARALPPVIRETVAEGQQRALAILDEEAPAEGSGLPAPEEVERMTEDALQASSDNLTITILLRRLSTERNPRTRHALVERLTRHYERFRVSGLRDETFRALLDTGRALLASGHVAEARQLYTLLENTPEEGLSEDAAHYVSLARRELRPMAVMPPIAVRRGQLTFIPLDQATTPAPAEQLPIRDEELAGLLQFPSTEALPAGYVAQASRFAYRDPHVISFESTIIPASPQVDPALTADVMEFLATDQGRAMLEQHHITDLRHMTIEQAVSLAADIVTARLEYDESIPLDVEIPQDEMSPLAILQQPTPEGQRTAGAPAICRHYTFTLSAVFGVLREQSPSTLGNSYMVTMGGRRSDAGSDPAIGHSWNVLFTQVHQDTWTVQMLDPTSQDDPQYGFALSLDATASASFGTQIDLVVLLANHGVISRGQAQQWLEAFVQQYPDSERTPFAHWFLANLYPRGSAQRLDHLQAIPTESPLYDNAVALAGGHLPAGPAAQDTAAETPLPPGTPPAPAEPEAAEAPVIEIPDGWEDTGWQDTPIE